MRFYLFWQPQPDCLIPIFACALWAPFATYGSNFVYTRFHQLTPRTCGSHLGGDRQNKKRPKGRLLFWQPQLDDFRTLLLRDYDEIVRNINALEDFLNGLNMSNVA